MPKDEFDFEDPLELTGHALITEEDTTPAMAECFVEEFMRIGYSPDRILALFRNPHYIGMDMVRQKHGEQFVRDCILQTFARWGRPFSWQDLEQKPAAPEPPRGDALGSGTHACLPSNGGSPVAQEEPTDPLGGPVPMLNL